VDEKDRFYSFERALRELRLKEEELKRLVSEGEIRAFRDEEKMKFRREDIERLKKKAPDKLDFSKSPSDASADTLADDLVFEEEEDLSLGDEEPGMQTAPISEETLVDEEEVGMTTEPLEEEREAPRVTSKKITSTTTKRTTSRSTRTRAAVTEKSGHPVLTAVLVLSSIVLFMGVFVALDLFRDQKSGLSAGIADFFAQNMTAPDK
jgi:hypothetical protein